LFNLILKNIICEYKNKISFNRIYDIAFVFSDNVSSGGVQSISILFSPDFSGCLQVSHLLFAGSGRLLAFGCWLLAFGCWPLAIGCWLLAVGFWLLAIGCWLLAQGFYFALCSLHITILHFAISLFRNAGSGGIDA
jgi:hypothetical protein